MTDSKSFASLSTEQQAAAYSNAENTLVLAGAGSGKTHILTRRFAWQVIENNIPPESIMCVTFTNKAANEMAKRIQSITHINRFYLQTGTFHSLAHRLIRQFAPLIKLSPNFQIIDRTDQINIIKNLIIQSNLDLKTYQPKNIQYFINQSLEKGMRLSDVKKQNTLHPEAYLSIYQAYEKYCQKNALIDFSNLLLTVYELFNQNQTAQQHIQESIHFVMIDEFQDVNYIQYQWIKLLNQHGAKIFAVGDDDQTIYGWRGANALTMQNFLNEFKNTRLIKLETNYRSTNVILQAANQLISNNKKRLGKNLKCHSKQTGHIQIEQYDDDHEEARKIAQKIQHLLQSDTSPGQIAILYRNNSQSRLLEEKLISLGISYKIYGGIRFFERAEIKNTLAYLRLILNTSDDNALKRILNFPPREIGQKTQNIIEQKSINEDTSLYHSIQTHLKHLPSRSKNALEKFTHLIEALIQNSKHQTLSNLIQAVYESTDMMRYYKKDETEQTHNSQVENLKELINAADEFEKNLKNQNITNPQVIQEFINQNALDTQHDNTIQHAITLSTLHSAKGLEFEHVFIVSLEEGILPGYQKDNIEEERRLMYVGITRAKKTLHLSHAEKRTLFGQNQYNWPSRFLKEIKTNTPLNSINTKKIQPRSYKIGQHIIHEKFGSGCIIQISGIGEKQIAEIAFKQYGTKQIMLSFAKLKH